MLIQRQAVNHPRPQQYTLSHDPNSGDQNPEPKDRVELTLGGAVKGALFGSATGAGAAAVVVAGGALLAAASGDSVRLSEVGTGILEVAALVAPAAAMVGAGTGAIVANTHSSQTANKAAMVAGGVTGVGALGYTIYSVIESLHSFHG